MVSIGRIACDQARLRLLAAGGSLTRP